MKIYKVQTKHLILNLRTLGIVLYHKVSNAEALAQLQKIKEETKRIQDEIGWDGKHHPMRKEIGNEIEQQWDDDEDGSDNSDADSNDNDDDNNDDNNNSRNKKRKRVSDE